MNIKTNRERTESQNEKPKDSGDSGDSGDSDDSEDSEDLEHSADWEHSADSEDSRRNPENAELSVVFRTRSNTA
jgi:hypothetical protein